MRFLDVDEISPLLLFQLALELFLQALKL